MNELVFRTLGSGSCGNMSVVRCGETTVLIDIGLSSQRLIRQRLETAGVDPMSITAALVSHSHWDHIGYAGLKFCSDMGIPVLGQLDTLNKATEMMVSKAGRLPDHGVLQVLRPGQRIVIRDLDVATFSVPHDVPTMGFILRPAGSAFPKLTVATDIGETGDDLVAYFMDSDAICIESNYNEKMLADSPRGPMDRARVKSTIGHLCNADAGRFVARVYNLSARKPDVVTLMHLSQDHNTPECAVEDFHAASGLQPGCFMLHAAPRDSVGPEVRLAGARRGSMCGGDVTGRVG